MLMDQHLQLLICRYFEEIGVEFEFYIPDRLKEGYGPNIDAFEKLIKNKCELIITWIVEQLLLKKLIF